MLLEIPWWRGEEAHVDHRDISCNSSNDLEAWPNSSVGREIDVQSQGSRVRIPHGSVIFSNCHCSFRPYPAAFTDLGKISLITNFVHFLRYGDTDFAQNVAQIR